MFQVTRKMGWTTPTIIVTVYGEVSSVVKAFKHGIHDFFQKPVPTEILLQSVRQCLETSIKSFDSERSKFSAKQRLERLTHGERKVLFLLVHGKSMKEIAAVFGTSFQAIYAHRKAILKKLDLAGDVLLAQWINNHGLETVLSQFDEDWSLKNKN